MKMRSYSVLVCFLFLSPVVCAKMHSVRIFFPKLISTWFADTAILFRIQWTEMNLKRLVAMVNKIIRNLNGYARNIPCKWNHYPDYFHQQLFHIFLIKEILKKKRVQYSFRINLFRSGWIVSLNQEVRITRGTAHFIFTLVLTPLWP